MGMDQYLLIQFLGGWTSINPSYFDDNVNYRGTIGFDPLPYGKTIKHVDLDGSNVENDDRQGHFKPPTSGSYWKWPLIVGLPIKNGDFP